jgi:hypothetical protein
VIFREIANGLGIRDFRIGREKLGLKLLQKFFPLPLHSFLFDGIGWSDIGHGLHWRDDRSQAGRDAITVVASGTSIEVRGIVKAAIGTRQPVACELARRGSVIPDTIAQVGANAVMASVAHVGANGALRL